MSTYEIIFWTVVVALFVVWFITDSDWARKRDSEQQGVPTEWDRYELQRKMLDAFGKQRKPEEQEQDHMKIIAEG